MVLDGQHNRRPVTSYATLAPIPPTVLIPAAAIVALTTLPAKPS